MCCLLIGAWGRASGDERGASPALRRRVGGSSPAESPVGEGCDPEPFMLARRQAGWLWALVGLLVVLAGWLWALVGLC